MGISNLKKKIIVGVLSTSLIGGASVAFADTDAGHQLGIWYNSEVATAVDGIVENITENRDKLVKTFDSWADSMKVDKAKAIAKANDDIEKDAKTKVDEAKKSHIDSIKDAGERINEKVGDDFNAIKNGYNKDITDQIGDRAYQQQLKIDKVIEKEKKDSVDENKASITDTKNEAKKELKRVITETKESITSKIDKNKDKSIEEINKHTEDTIKDREKAMQKATDEYTEKIIGEIKDETKISQDAAIGELDDMINEISETTEKE